jgi:hypothetical protein
MSRRTMLRRAALASSVVASMPTVLPYTKPASARRCSIQVKTASRVSRSITRRVLGDRRMIRRSVRQHHTEKLAQGKRISCPPGDRTLRIQALEIADQQEPEVTARRQSGPAIVRIEPLAEPFDERVEVMIVENLIQSCVERVRGGAWQISCVATHIDVCFGRRRRLPIAMGDSVVRGIDCVDPFRLVHHVK